MIKIALKQVVILVILIPLIGGCARERGLSKDQSRMVWLQRLALMTSIAIFNNEQADLMLEAKMVASAHSLGSPADIYELFVVQNSDVANFTYVLVVAEGGTFSYYMANVSNLSERVWGVHCEETITWLIQTRGILLMSNADKNQKE